MSASLSWLSTSTGAAWGMPPTWSDSTTGTNTGSTASNWYNGSDSTWTEVKPQEWNDKYNDNDSWELKDNKWIHHYRDAWTKGDDNQWKVSLMSIILNSIRYQFNTLFQCYIDTAVSIILLNNTNCFTVILINIIIILFIYYQIYYAYY